jgi:hypothetical protein
MRLRFKQSFVKNGMPIVMEVKCGGNFTTDVTWSQFQFFGIFCLFDDMMG